MFYLIIAAVVVLLDQLSKHYLTLLVKDGAMPLIPGIVRMVYVQNTGAAFSLFSDMRWVLVATTSVTILAILVVLLRYSRHFGKASCVALSLVLGGAIGNLIDRVLFGYVADFFEFEFVRFAVFNVADIFITIGGVAFILLYMLRPTGDKKVVLDGSEASEALSAHEAAAGALSAEPQEARAVEDEAVEDATEGGEAAETMTEPDGHAED